MLSKIRNGYRKFEEYFIIGLLVFSTLSVCYSVFMRFVFNSPPAWVEEMVCYFQVWIAFVGISYVARNQDDFIRFDFIIHRMNPKARTIVKIVEMLLLLAFMIMMDIVSTNYLIKTFNFGGVSTPMRVPNYIPRIILPVSFYILTIHYIESIVDEIKECKNIFTSK